MTADFPNLIPLFEELLRDNPKELSSHLLEVCKTAPIPGTAALLNCHILQLDGNQRPKERDLAAFIANQAVNYCIPRSQIQEAVDYHTKFNSTKRFVELTTKARQLFVSLE